MGGTELKWHRGKALSWSVGTNKRWYVTRRKALGFIPMYHVFARREPHGEVVSYASGFLTRGSAERWVINEDQFYKEKVS